MVRSGNWWSHSNREVGGDYLANKYVVEKSSIPSRLLNQAVQVELITNSLNIVPIKVSTYDNIKFSEVRQEHIRSSDNVLVDYRFVSRGVFRRYVQAGKDDLQAWKRQPDGIKKARPVI